VPVASFGSNVGNNNMMMLGVRAIRTAAGNDWTTTAIGLGMDVDNTIRAGASLFLGHSGNVGIGTNSPNYSLHVGNQIAPSNYFLRVDGPTAAGTTGQVASFGSNGNFVIDAVGVVGGRFGVWENGNVTIGCPNGTDPCPSNIFTIGPFRGHAVADGWDSYSSRRWKTNIQTLHGALAKVEQLRGVSYDLKTNGKHEVGVIAEEVGAVVPEIVTFEHNGKDARSVDYSRLTVLLIEATKEQQTLIQKQQQQIKAEQAQINVQQAQIAGLTKQVKTIRAALRSERADSQVHRASAQLTDHQ
jgi:hypothetical protein